MIVRQKPLNKIHQYYQRTQTHDSIDSAIRFEESQTRFERQGIENLHTLLVGHIQKDVRHHADEERRDERCKHQLKCTGEESYGQQRVHERTVPAQYLPLGTKYQKCHKAGDPQCGFGSKLQEDVVDNTQGTEAIDEGNHAERQDNINAEEVVLRLSFGIDVDVTDPTAQKASRDIDEEGGGIQWPKQRH